VAQRQNEVRLLHNSRPIDQAALLDTAHWLHGAEAVCSATNSVSTLLRVNCGSSTSCVSDMHASASTAVVPCWQQLLLLTQSKLLTLLWCSRGSYSFACINSKARRISTHAAVVSCCQREQHRVCHSQPRDSLRCLQHRMVSTLTST
jgi:hypothetical protein